MEEEEERRMERKAGKELGKGKGGERRSGGNFTKIRFSSSLSLSHTSFSHFFTFLFSLFLPGDIAVGPPRLRARLQLSLEAKGELLLLPHPAGLPVPPQRQVPAARGGPAAGVRPVRETATTATAAVPAATAALLGIPAAAATTAIMIETSTISNKFYLLRRLSRTVSRRVLNVRTHIRGRKEKPG